MTRVDTTVTRTLTPPEHYHLARSVAPLILGRYDPCGRFADDEFWLAGRTPDGPGTVRLGARRRRTRRQSLRPRRGLARRPRRRDRGPARRRERFPGAGRAPSAGGAAGPHVRRDADAGHRPALPRASCARYWNRRSPAGRRTGRTGRSSGTSASRRPARSRCCCRPTPAAVAATPYWRFHPFGVEQRRTQALLRAAAVADRLERCADSAEATRRLTAIPGIGPWTAAEVVRIAYGDPDAVSVGDYHIPQHGGVGARRRAARHRRAHARAARAVPRATAAGCATCWRPAASGRRGSARGCRSGRSPASDRRSSARRPARDRPPATVGRSWSNGRGRTDGWRRRTDRPRAGAGAGERGLLRQRDGAGLASGQPDAPAGAAVAAAAGCWPGSPATRTGSWPPSRSASRWPVSWPRRRPRCRWPSRWSSRAGVPRLGAAEPVAIVLVTLAADLRHAGDRRAGAQADRHAARRGLGAAGGPAAGRARRDRPARRCGCSAWPPTWWSGWPAATRAPAARRSPPRRSATWSPPSADFTAEQRDHHQRRVRDRRPDPARDPGAPPRRAHAADAACPPHEALRAAARRRALPGAGGRAGGLDDVIGVVHLRDLVGGDRPGRRSGPARAVAARDAAGRPTRCASCARERQQFALVVDERGAIDGIVTMEDLRRGDRRRDLRRDRPGRAGGGPGAGRRAADARLVPDPRPARHRPRPARTRGRRLHHGRRDGAGRAGPHPDRAGGGGARCRTSPPRWSRSPAGPSPRIRLPAVGDGRDADRAE